MSGVITEMITLHVGYGTFQPIRSQSISDHEMHSETFHIPKATADRLLRYKKEGKKIISVGTTSTRALETAYINPDTLLHGSHSSNLFIYPGYSFNFIDGMITNFHLPKSSLFMLVCALSSTSLMKTAYETAINHRYRFYSLGDAMLIL